MILRLSAALAATVLLLTACGSGADDPQPAQSQPVAYEAGDSESRQQTEAEAEQVPASAGTETSEQEAMVGQIIESGHRAGLFADRNSLGDPDAPIVITEYSDFL